MKIEPVYLVAPERPSLIPTRRAMLFAGLSFFGGAAAGGAAGFQVGRGDAAAPVGGSEEPPKSGNAELDQLRWLAVEAPIDELFSNAVAFIDAVEVQFPKDTFLWRGVRRLVDAVMTRERRGPDRAIVQYLIRLIRGYSAEAGQLRGSLPALEALVR